MLTKRSCFGSFFFFWGQVCYNEEHIRRRILADGEQGADSDLVSVGSSGLDRHKGQIE